MEFEINHTWDGLPLNHDPVTIVFKPADEGLAMVVTAPFFIDPPPPPGKPGKPFPGLWDYEVVEAFFLCHESKQYLEVELCPHGQHLILLISGRRNVWKQELPLTFDVTRKDTSWEGSALIPWSYFPHGVDRFNAYAIHGSGDSRTYEALYPIPQSKIEVGQQPDFHRLEYFEPFSFDAIMGEAWKQPVSDLWMTQLPDKCQ